MNISNRDCVVIGIDPGIRNTGWGVIRVEGNNLLHLCHGVIKTEDNQSDALRLNFIANSLDEIIKKYSQTLLLLKRFLLAIVESQL